MRGLMYICIGLRHFHERSSGTTLLQGSDDNFFRGIEVSALIDTGCMVNVVYKEVYDEIVRESE